MGCWKWFNMVLEEAGVEVTEENRDRIDRTIQEYIDERSAYGKCSAVLSEASSQISGDRNMRDELISRVQAAARGELVESRSGQ